MLRIVQRSSPRHAVKRFWHIAPIPGKRSTWAAFGAKLTLIEPRLQKADL
jgi:hypothetical protein